MILRQSSIQEFDEVKLGCDYKLAKMAAEVKMLKCGKIPTRVVDTCCNATCKLNFGLACSLLFVSDEEIGDKVGDSYRGQGQEDRGVASSQ